MLVVKGAVGSLLDMSAFLGRPVRHFVKTAASLFYRSLGSSRVSGIDVCVTVADRSRMSPLDSGNFAVTRG